MVSPLHVRLLYWPVYAACFMGALFFSWHFSWSKQFSEAKYVFPSIAVAFSQIAATWTCRFLGYSLERRVETRIEPQSGASFQDEVEIRSFSSNQIFKTMVWIWLGGAGIVVLLAPFLLSRGPGSVGGFYFILAVLLALAVGSKLMAWMGRQGCLSAKAGANGVEVNVGLGEWRRFKWEEIDSAARMELFDVFGSLVNTHIQLKNARGKVCSIIYLNSVAPEEQQRFSQVISRHLGASSPT